VVVLSVVVEGLEMGTFLACVHGGGCDGDVDESWTYHPHGCDEVCLYATGGEASESEICRLVI